MLAVVIVEVAARHGAALESPADPSSSYLARSEWYALPLFQLRMYFDGPLEIVATMIIPGVVSALLLALPFLDRGRSNRPSERKPVMAAIGASLLAVGALSTIALVKDARSPAYAKARAEEETRTRQARRLAGKGMPAEGGLAVFQNDPLNHARAIWEERCSGCHGLGGAGGDKGPDFKDYGSRAWIRGFLENPEGPLYMGTAKIDRGMKPVVGTPDELDALVEMVYAQTGAPDADAAKVARGHSLIAQKDCDTCHELDGEGENAGPNLKGRGTLAWVEACHRRRWAGAPLRREEQDAEVRRQADAGRNRGLGALSVVAQEGHPAAAVSRLKEQRTLVWDPPPRRRPMVLRPLSATAFTRPRSSSMVVGLSVCFASCAQPGRRHRGDGREQRHRRRGQQLRRRHRRRREHRRGRRDRHRRRLDGGSNVTEAAARPEPAAARNWRLHGNRRHWDRRHHRLWRRDRNRRHHRLRRRDRNRWRDGLGGTTRTGGAKGGSTGTGGVGGGHRHGRHHRRRRRQGRLDGTGGTGTGGTTGTGGAKGGSTGTGGTGTGGTTGTGGAKGGSTGTGGTAIRN